MSAAYGDVGVTGVRSPPGPPKMAGWRSRRGRRGSRPRVVVIDHHDSYTWNLVHLLAGIAGQLPTVVQHDQVGADDILSGEFTHVVLSPGPGRPDVVGDFSVGADVVWRARIPILGVCLGMQGIVTALGGLVEQVSPAHGMVSSIRHDGHPMFAAVPAEFDGVRYHSLAATVLPTCLQPTAWCGPLESPVVMAVAHTARPVLGVQFHPESVLTQFGEQLVSTFLELR